MLQQSFKHNINIYNIENLRWKKHIKKKRKANQSGQNEKGVFLSLVPVHVGCKILAHSIKRGVR